MNSLDEIFNGGRNEATSDIQNFDYDSISWIISRLEDGNTAKNLVNDTEFLEYSGFDEDENFNEMSDELQVTYLEGWLNGFKATWDEVKYLVEKP